MGRKESGSFVMLPHTVLEHENYARRSHRAIRLLIDLYGQYRGNNNGDLCLAWTIMTKKGWKSKDQLHKAKKELLDSGWIIVTRQGGRNKCSLYAVTFKSIDYCNGKLDVKETHAALGDWKGIQSVKITTPAPNEG